jgi:GMP synthase-like glutamine amidotransferase
MLLAVQHIACEPQGAYEGEPLAWGGELHRVEVDDGERLPDWREFDGIVVMGGPMGAYEEQRLPWLVDEKRLLAAATRAGKPTWGVCLGAQLAGREPRRRSGARRRARGRGTTGVRTTAAARDPVFSLCPQEFLALQWHADTHKLPAGAVQFARSTRDEQQAFVAGRAYAMQFHIEVSAALARELGQGPAYADGVEAILGDGALAALLERVAAHEREMTGLARRLFAAWLEHGLTVPQPRL